MTRRHRGTAVDGHLLAQAEDGNHEAVRQMAAEAAEHVRALVDQCDLSMDDVTPFILRVFDAIAAGKSPNEAFGWAKTNPRADDALIKWNMALHVEALKSYMSEADAIALVGQAANKGGEKGGTVYNAWKKYQHDKSMAVGDYANIAGIPDDLYPIAPTAKEAIADMDRRVALLLADRTRRR